MGRATAQYFGPAPWVPVEGKKGQISFNFNYKVNFKDFKTNLVSRDCCVALPRGAMGLSVVCDCGIS